MQKFPKEVPTAAPQPGVPAASWQLGTGNCLSCYAAQNSDIVPGWPVLIELRLENYAVIDNAAVEFASGLNLLTG